MKGRKCKEPPSADLLVCFPSRSHLHYHHHFKKSSTIGVGAGQASPLVWAKSKRTEISEPTSPKVTCAGQIKARHKPKPCKNWESVMEEIEKLHNNRRNKKKAAWIEALGFKKEAMQFFNCLRNTIRFDFRCFGSFPTAADIIITSDDDEEQEEENNEVSRRTVFSKWFMVLQENQNIEKEKIYSSNDEECVDDRGSSAPPQNALLLMRSRSAPAKSWLELKQEEKGTEFMEKKKKSLVVMRYKGSDLYKLSSDIAKETWVVGGVTDALSRSRSCKNW